MKAAGEAERNGSAKKPMTKAERQTEKNRQKTADRKTRDRKNTLMEVRCLTDVIEILLWRGSRAAGKLQTLQGIPRE